MDSNTPLPKSQEQLSQESITPYIDNSKPGLNKNRDRANQRSLAGDNVQTLTVGIKDIDEALYYYFNNVIKPSVIQNDKVINVPLVYGSPERWAAMQKDGYYRDKNGKMQAPVIVFRRNSVEKNRTLGNKLDANNPHNFGIFEKKFSSKNVYDRFGLLNNRIPEKELYAVAIPDYVNIKYSCIIYTDYVEQNNKIIEGVNFASDSYWGDPNKFQFRAMIDSYNTVSEVVQGNDRIIKTEFEINLLGHIISDVYNAQLNNSKKVYSKTNVKITAETVNKL